MTTRHTPPTIPSVETGTPPTEWSDSVLASKPPRDTLPTLSNISGSPNTAEDESQVRKDPENHQAQPSDKSKPSVGRTAVQTAKQSVPEQVGKTVDYATQTAAAAASYLVIPQGIKDTVSSYLSSKEREEEPHVSLPSTELRGAQPLEHTGGVGALPGNLSESSVALLPDERQERAQEPQPTSPRQRRDTIKLSAAGGDDEPQEFEKGEEANTARDGEPLASQPSDAPPSKSTEARAAETVESNIAVRSGPEVGPQKEASEMKSQEALSEQGKAVLVATTDTVGTTPSAQELEVEGSNLASGQLGQEKGPSQDVREEGNKEGRTTTAGKVEGGYGGEYHPAQLHPPPPGASVAEYQTSVSAQQEEQALPTLRTGKRASVGAEKKPGFMTMVKGEMKILAGKMSGDEHKVEEGKKIVHGEA